ELTQLRVDAIVTYNNPAVAALQRATRTIPIIAANMGDPVGSGFVASLARPGGNITGFSGLSEELSRKWVELLREAVPRISRVAVLTVSQTPAADTRGRAGLRQPHQGPCARTDRAAARGDQCSSNPDRPPRDKTAAAGDVPGSGVCGGRRSDLLRGNFLRPPPAARRPRRQGPQGREARRSADPAADHVRTGRQSPYREGARA